MRNWYVLRVTMALLTTLPAALSAQAPSISAVTPVATTVEQYGKFEAALTLTATYTNPYDYDEIRVEAIFVSPSGESTSVEGFYAEDFTLNTTTGNVTPVTNAKGFKVRFSPRQPGAWTYTVRCTNAAGTGTFTQQTFTCTAATPGNKGFVRWDQTSNYLTFSNGEPYVPVGQNVAWQQSNVYLDYTKWVGKMSDQGANFLRLWLCHWGLGLEWKNNSSGFSGLKKYKQSSAYYLDWLFDHCAEKGVYVMLCLNHHGQVSSQVNPNWSENPYSAANGGPCVNTWDFFTNSQAKNLHKNRLRYILARWGYQRSIATWELFNEVNWTDNFEQHLGEIKDWHTEMATFLKTNDATQRPVSTSYGSPESEDPALWADPNLDYTQRHYYLDSPNLEAVLAAGVRENLDLYGKPALIGEFGLGTAGTGLSALDPTGIYIHNNLWGPLFGGGLGTGMSWWWDNYIEPQNLYTHFAGVSALTQQIGWHADQYQPVTGSVAGAPGDLQLNPSLGWAALADTSYTISNTGVVTPAANLSQFLYGASWNTQYRRPPVFNVNYPTAGTFSVTVSQIATTPKLTIRLDGNLLVNVAPVAGQTYQISVPAGQHTIRVDNTGTDWLQVSAYTFGGLGSAVSAYLLRSADQSRLTGWLLNNRYNHVYVKANGAPDAVEGATLNVSGLSNGDYNVQWFNCLTGALGSTATATVNNGNLALTVPDLSWDLAFVLENAAVGTAHVAPPLGVNVFPNPVAGNGRFTVDVALERADNVQVTLLDAAGGVRQQLFAGRLDAGAQQVSVALPGDLPAGIYWALVQVGSRQAVRAIGVVK